MNAVTNKTISSFSRKGLNNRKKQSGRVCLAGTEIMRSWMGGEIDDALFKMRLSSFYPQSLIEEYLRKHNQYYGEVNQAVQIKELSLQEFLFLGELNCKKTISIFCKPMN